MPRPHPDPATGPRPATTTATRRLRVLRRRRRGAGPRPSWPTCSAATPDRPGRTAVQRHRGPAGAGRRSRSTSSSATSRCPAWTGWTWPGCSPGSAQPPAGRLRHRVRGARGRRLRAARDRLRDEAGARRAAGRGGPPGASPRAPDAATATRRPAPRTRRSRSSSAGVTPVRAAQPGPLREAHGDYARLHTADRQPPRPGLAQHAGGALGATAGFVRIHRSTLVALPHISEVRMDRGRCTRASGRRRAAGEPAAHPRAARHCCVRAGREPAAAPRRGGRAVTTAPPSRPRSGCG